MADNSLGSQGLEIVAECVKEHPFLQTLDLSGRFRDILFPKKHWLIIKRFRSARGYAIFIFFLLYISFLLVDKGNDFNESDAVHIAEMLEVFLHICQKQVFSQQELIASLNQNASNSFLLLIRRTTDH